MLDATATEFLSFPDLLKATPAQEAGGRFIYFEASNEARDQQNEVVLQKALQDSAETFLQSGNIDIDHFTQIGPKLGIADYNTYEIGQPVQVKADGKSTFVKAQLYQGDTPMAARANEVWDSLTKLSPPARWRPSVGGAVLEKEAKRDPATGCSHTIIKRVRWVNVGISRTPVNQTVPTVQTVPFGALAKSWTAAGLNLSKALEAGYGTDSATLEGGAALRGQSLDPKLQSYWDFRDRVAGDIRKRVLKGDAAGLVAHAQSTYGLPASQAAEWTERFHADLRTGLKQRKMQ